MISLRYVLIILKWLNRFSREAIRWYVTSIRERSNRIKSVKTSESTWWKRVDNDSGRDHDQIMITWSDRHIESSGRIRWTRSHRYHTLEETCRNVVHLKIFVFQVWETMSNEWTKEFVINEIQFPEWLKREWDNGGWEESVFDMNCRISLCTYTSLD